MAVRNFVVQTLPCQDAIAAVNLTNQGFEVFQPALTIIKKHPRYERLTSTVLEPLFPGYLFIKFDPQQQQWRSINGTRGVKRVLGECEYPTPVPVGVVEEIERQFALGAYQHLEPTSPTVRAGSRARVILGPFEGLTGTCIASRVGRVKLLLNILGGAVQVMFPPASVVSVAV